MEIIAVRNYYIIHTAARINARQMQALSIIPGYCASSSYAGIHTLMYIADGGDLVSVTGLITGIEENERGGA